MCGITGFFNDKNASESVFSSLKAMDYRGLDCFGIHVGNKTLHTKDVSQIKFAPKDSGALGHCLHSIVGFVPQPLKKKGVLVANCEIYNWKDLKKEYNLNPRNDAELILHLIEAIGLEETLERLDGVYAFAYWNGDELVLCRDILGVKPLWFSHGDSFCFSSEKKTLENLGHLNINELNPREILRYDIKENKLEFVKRDFFITTPLNQGNMEELETFFIDAIKKRIPKGAKFGLLFSGGLDSTIIALLFKKLGLDFTCYTSAFEHEGMAEAKDLTAAKKVAKELNLDLKVKKLKLDEIEPYLKKIVPLIEDSNAVKVGVALTFFAACEEAKKDGNRVIFSGLGSEEIFAGYNRHRESSDINKECLSGLLKIYERDMYRDDVITMFNNLELRLPFLDKKLVDYSLKIPSELKIKGDVEKAILRDLAKKLGLKDEFADRKKKAAQYGSNFDKALVKLVKKAKLKYRSEYLKQFYPKHNLKLGALCSSGKDSIYAVFTMIRQNYDVSCLISLKSKNPSSYMFHTPNIDLVKLQSESMNIPLVEQETKGEKEKELVDLKKALEKAKEEFNIEGVITGALFSTYQRDRVEKVCEELGLKVFSPLWHINQETLMRELIKNDFKVILSSIAADGLDESWLGKELKKEDIDILVELNKKNKINIAFEGGEAESLVLDCPLFEKKIVVEDSKVIEESENVAFYKIKKAKLKKKEN